MKLFHKGLALFYLLLALNISGCGKTQSGKSPYSTNLIPFATGLRTPVCIANAGDSRLFAADQHGYINIIDSAGKVNPQPFLDIHERVTYGGEQGLLGLAFHPQYKANGYFYVNYIGLGDSTHISRFSMIPGSTDLADPRSEMKIMTIFQPYANHNGGGVCFGPDGYLYLGLGDGGSAGDPGNRAQNRMEYLGKILRIDVDQGNPYAIPPTNPFYGSGTARGEIWAMGLRNPWRFSFDRLTGDLWIADVGQNQIEEVDFQPADSHGGENYGWRCYEGNQVYNNAGCTQAASYTFPVYTYPHGAECSVTGGYVYRGSASVPFYGFYFFADYCSDRIWTLHNVSGTWVKEDFGQFPGNGFSTFGEDAGGQLYVAGLTSGTIFRVSDGPIGISDADAPKTIQIIRIPFSDKIRIESGRTDRPVIHLIVVDIRGVILYNAITREAHCEFDLSFLPAGTYVLNVGVDGKKFVQKLIKGKQD
jgi:glucose/arabinose dehydrogenase